MNHKSLPADVSSFEITLIVPSWLREPAPRRVEAVRGTRRPSSVTVSVVAAPKGIARVTGVLRPIFTVATDEKWNVRGYRVPGSDEAGERLFGV